MERGRRNASRTDAAKEKLAALAAQKQSGKKRVETFEAKREEAVYDEVRRAGGLRRGCACRGALPAGLTSMLAVSSRAAPARAAQLDEKSYANLVAKRRMETGGFVVGDAEGGCARRGVAREGRQLKAVASSSDAPRAAPQLRGHRRGGRLGGRRPRLGAGGRRGGCGRRRAGQKTQGQGWKGENASEGRRERRRPPLRPAARAGRVDRAWRAVNRPDAVLMSVQGGVR
jgi:hypothetical protein